MRMGTQYRGSSHPRVRTGRGVVSAEGLRRDARSPLHEPRMVAAPLTTTGRRNDATLDIFKKVVPSCRPVVVRAVGLSRNAGSPTRPHALLENRAHPPTYPRCHSRMKSSG